MFGIKSLFVVASLIVVSLFFEAGCGGNLSTTPVTDAGSPPTSPPPPSPTPSPNPSPLAAPTIVSVGAGQSVSGIDINVSTPVDSPTPNAQMLGVTNVGQGGTATNVGDSIHRGTTMNILVFGQGLNGSLTVTISGPKDIAISNVASVTSVDGITGVQFNAAVAANAALGARTVRLRSAANDVTTFTGGLEVLP